jgi:hypothetical protein
MLTSLLIKSERHILLVKKSDHPTYNMAFTKSNFCTSTVSDARFNVAVKKLIH